MTKELEQEGFSMEKVEALQAMASWPIEERIEFVQEAWDQIVDAGWQPQPSEELKAELDRRIEAADANPDDVVSWEAIVEYVRRQR